MFGWQRASESRDALTQLRVQQRALGVTEVLENNFLGEPFSFDEVKERWPRFVQTLGISEDQAKPTMQHLCARDAVLVVWSGRLCAT